MLTSYCVSSTNSDFDACEPAVLPFAQKMAYNYSSEAQFFLEIFYYLLQ